MSTEMAANFAAEAGTAPVVNVSGVDAPTVGTPNATNSTTTLPVNTPKFYTEEDLARVRSQEKDKLYPVIDELKNELAALKKEKEEKAARKAAKEAEEAAKEAEKAKAKQEKDMDAKEFAKVTAEELREQLERERQERERAFALLEQERKYAELKEYKQQLLEQERENVMPQLLKYLQGNSPEELNASLEDLKAQTASILQDAQAALQAQRQQQVGTRATLPPNGPLETNSEQRQYSAEELKALPMSEYSKIRASLLSPRAQGQTRGILG